MQTEKRFISYFIAAAAALMLAACAPTETDEDEPLLDSDETPLEDYWTLEHAVDPQYPEQALEDGVEGRVTVHATIGRDGRVEEVAIVELVPDETFAEPVVEAVMEYRYEPTEANEDRRPMVTQLSFEFSPDQFED